MEREDRGRECWERYKLMQNERREDRKREEERKRKRERDKERKKRKEQWGVFHILSPWRPEDERRI